MFVNEGVGIRLLIQILEVCDNFELCKCDGFMIVRLFGIIFVKENL